tara:strand:- start:57 stop:413 length:357 start_codon:yes stop_codon:yes gene_type:complete
MLKATFLRDYVSGNGNPTFVYAVSGEKEGLKAYEKAQGKFYRVDEKTGEILWFTTRFIGDAGKLVITSNGNVVADMSAFRKAESLATQFGGNLGEQLAKQAAINLLGGSKSSEGLSEV